MDKIWFMYVMKDNTLVSFVQDTNYNFLVCFVKFWLLITSSINQNGEFCIMEFVNELIFEGITAA